MRATPNQTTPDGYIYAATFLHAFIISQSPRFVNRQSGKLGIIL
ncbi:MULTISPECIES: hypothetical protein [Oscillatoriales]|nr:hypothetical protein [Arthrospira platensis NCB002]WAK74152.1 hypothetical protein AP9108_32540 [Arthrospira sp. PCC 9108]